MTSLPPLFGRPSDAAKALDRRIDAGERLLAKIHAVAEDVSGNSVTEQDPLYEFLLAEKQSALVDPLPRKREEWSRRNRHCFVQYFGKAGGIFYEKLASEIPAVNSPLSEIDRCEALLSKELEKLRGVAKTLPSVEADTGLQSKVDLRFLLLTDLVQAKVVHDFERRLSGLRDKRNLSRVIGASKELLEAVDRGALYALTGLEPPNGLQLPELGKQVRNEIKQRIRIAPQASTKIEEISGKFLGTMSTIEQEIATMRNSFGEGHGRHRAPVGLELRHGRLAVDCALMYCRYIAATIQDLGIC